MLHIESAKPKQNIRRKLLVIGERSTPFVALEAVEIVSGHTDVDSPPGHHSYTYIFAHLVAGLSIGRSELIGLVLQQSVNFGVRCLYRLQEYI